ncbi:SRPBCC family protein [Actinokineospora guangxiensis]|uniref:SRPBCC family protein n=1 Tax=Actinokineospora guangxiensis TaxID=1490288 RepID=A0ABW0EKE4_9PSEU
MSRKFTVAKSPSEVVDYLRDFARAEEWDPGTVSCTRKDDGPVRVGSTWRNVSKFLGQETELTYELTKAGPDHLQFVGRNKTATSTDDIAIEPGSAPGTTEITYRAHIEFNGVAKLATPVAKVAMERLGDETEESLRRILGPVGVD